MRLMTPNERRAAHLHATFGISQPDYEQFLTEQGGVCAICHVAPDARHHLVVDHDFDTGEVRGLLCQPCNAALELFNDDPKVLAKATRYLLSRSAVDAASEREARVQQPARPELSFAPAKDSSGRRHGGYT